LQTLPEQAGGDSEEQFLQRLAAATDLQTDMALEVMIPALSEPAQRLLEALAAYQTPVPREGIIALALAGDQQDPAIADADDGEALLQSLCDRSLVEFRAADDLPTLEYASSPLVADWLAQHQRRPPTSPQKRAAADYQAYLFRRERPTLNQAIAVHRARQLAGQAEMARRFALDYIVGNLSRQGLYATLIEDWLPDLRRSTDPATRAKALNQSGKQHHHIGAYDTSLRYLQNSLSIYQEISDKAGVGTTLNNISQVFRAHGDYDIALQYLQDSLTIRQEIGDKAGLCAVLFNMGHIQMQNNQAQQAVATWVQVYRLAQPIGLDGGLQGWARLAAQMDDRDKPA
jgi:tetratricopeptide (TPR) repeat protein